MILSDLSIKKPVFAWMIMASLLLFGAVTFNRLGVAQNPDVDAPIVNVRVTWEGAAPEIMENEVIDPIEEAMMTVEGIKKVTSSSRFGSANVTVEFDLDKDINVAVQEVQSKISQAQRNLPSDIDPPVIQKVNPEDQPIMWVGISGTRPYKEITTYVQDHLLDQFQTIPGAGEVTLGGFVEPNLRVWLDLQKMNELEMTVDDVISAIELQHSELPAGVLQNLKEERNVRVLGEAKSVEEFGNLTIPSRAGQGIIWTTIRLKDIATIEEGLADVRRISRINGEPSIGMGIRKQRDANAVDVAKRAKKKIEEVQKTMPKDMTIGVNFDTTKFIEDNIHELVVTMVLAIIFTSIVCWLFLGSLTSTLNVILAIPTALGGTIMVIYFLGFTLNTITLMAISLVIGIVVDDAIVVLENIVRHREQGKSMVTAAIHGSREITFSVIVISSAVIAIFLPVAFMKGMIGKFFYQFGVTVSIAVFFSLIEAITIAPMRCSQFLQVKHDTAVSRRMEGILHKLTTAYSSTLALALGHRWKVLLGTMAFFVVSLLIAGGLRREMTPPMDQGTFTIRFQTPPGSSLAFTDDVFKKMEEVFKSRAEIAKYFGNVGGFSGEVNSGNIFITMKPLKERPNAPGKNRPIKQQEFMPILRKELKDIKGVRRVALQDRSQTISAGSGRGFPIELSIQGPDWEKLGEYSETIREKLMATNMAVDVDTNYQLGIPEVRIMPDREQAAARGVTTSAIARTINAMIGGVRAGKYTKGGRRYDIRVSLRDVNRSDPNDISRLLVRNVRGELIPLSDVTKIIEKPTLLNIQRENRQRAITVSGNITPGKSQADALKTALTVAHEVLPEGYYVTETGNTEQFRETFNELTFALFLGIAIAYMILAAQFNSFIHPLVILLALPFSLSGALMALWIGNHSLNMMSMIGILLLMGIVKKNSILLVDFTNSERLAGHAPDDALRRACPIRLRPILMTSLAIVAGAIPATMALGPGAELRAPMGAVVIGGTILSTLLTLYVVPCAYSLMSRFESKNRDARMREVTQAISSSTK